MPYCSILECNNDSRRKNLFNGGVSYHRFPKDPNEKEKWVDATGRTNWVPTKNSTICSEHFAQTDLIISNKGLRYLKPTAVPILNIMMVYDNYDQVKKGVKRKADTTTPMGSSFEGGYTNTTPTIDQQGGPKPAKISTRRESGRQKKPQTTNAAIETSKDPQICLTPRKKLLKGQLRFCENKIIKQGLKIKRLQSTNRRLKKKIKNIGEILAKLEEKFSMSKENLDCLKNTNIQVQELVARQVKNTESGVVSRKKYPPALRSFALTLHYYSPKAYDYVRKTFHTSLPHTRTIKKWYSKIGGEPGFTTESLAALKMKADSSNNPILATLVIDEMSIRRRVEWDGRKFHGYVDMGTELDGDHLAEAKEALVFLVTAINSNFKVPVGFFLVDGVSGEKRAHLVNHCLELIHNAGVRVVALTFDGCAANISMAKYLGCSFQEEQVKFEHPVTKDSIVAVLDPCHMIKLLRNTFEFYNILIDKDGNKIKWQHLVELNRLQYDETFHLSNKLRDRHVNFHNERMKVKLATQLFSKSVAEGIKFCRQSGIEAFNDSEPTERFLITCNNLFDVFNSRNLHFYGFKKALNENNARQTFKFLNEASCYIRNLKMENGTLLVNSPRKTGFIRFLGCIKALEHLYSSLIQTKILLCLPFYKLSQDHLELFFCNIRAHGGFNNNPTARQFISAYKKMLTHVQLRDTSKGNCVALEQIAILNCSSAVERINKSINVPHDQDVSLQEQNEAESEEIRDEYFSDFSNQAIGYIAGYIVRTLMKKINCDVCVKALVTHHFQPFHKFIIARDQGGLLYPAPDVVKICQTAETYLKNIDGVKGFCKEHVMLQIMRKFIGTHLFEDISSHQLGEFPASNHITDLIKAIVEKYINVRIHHLLKLKVRLSKRQFLNKYVLFEGQ